MYGLKTGCYSSSGWMFLNYIRPQSTMPDTFDVRDRPIFGFGSGAESCHMITFGLVSVSAETEKITFGRFSVSA